MRSPTDNRTLRKPVASFNSCGADYFSAKRGNAAEAGGEVVEDMNSLGLKGDSEGLSNSPCDVKASTSSIANLSQKPRSFAGAWKPVIDGKIQLSTDPSSNNSNWSSDVSKSTAWNSPMRSPTAFMSPRQQEHESEKPTVSNVSSDLKKDDDGNDSDSEFRRVPEMPEKGKAQSQKSNAGGSSSRKRSGASNDKEGKRLKRLLRNRVSAQQARERKKAYLIELEHKAKELELRNAELEEKTATLQRENYMLRQIVKNTTMLNKGASE